MGSADKKQYILDVATRVATVKGLSGLSVRSVATAAGIGATTLRAYFPSQALLYQAVAERLISHAIVDDWIRDTSVPVVRRLYLSVRQFLPPAENRHHALTAWFELLAVAVGPSANDEVRRMLQSGQEESRAIATRWFARLAADGHTLRDLPETLAQRLIVLVDGLQLALLLDRSDEALAKAEDMLLWFATESLSGPESRS